MSVNGVVVSVWVRAAPSCQPKRRLELQNSEGVCATFCARQKMEIIKPFVLTNKKTDIKYGKHQDWVDAQANLPSRARWSPERGCGSSRATNRDGVDPPNGGFFYGLASNPTAEDHS